MAVSSTLNVRQQDIMKQVNKEGNVLIKDMAVECKVSEATIRRDLDELTASGLIERIHGGAVRLSSTTFERYHSEKMKTMLNEKRKIASYAASLVENGDSIFLDSGTTTFFLAHELANHSDLTVITNNIDIAYS
ncbi:MAG: DeoR/GlpR family DNA-binding transcription regulator, partial [Oscillospiraceae bacterium]